jgi:glutamate synthase (NADPH/NADH) small chain
MEFLTQSNRRREGDEIPEPQTISAKDKHVVILGGGDTGADCIGTSHRQGAKSVTSLEIMPRPPEKRAEGNPWPEWPLIYRTASAHEEGGERLYAVSTKRFVGDTDGNVTGLDLVKVEMKKDADGRMRFEEIPNSLHTIPADRVFLAMGFLGPERPGMLEQLGVRLTERGNVARDASWMTSVPGVFTAGDMQRGQSLIVWAIAEGRSAAAGVDRYLMGSTDLPAPLP